MSTADDLYEEIKALVPKIVPNPDDAFALMRLVINYAAVTAMETNQKAHERSLQIIRETFAKSCDTPPPSSPSL